MGTRAAYRTRLSFLKQLRQHTSLIIQIGKPALSECVFQLNKSFSQPSVFLLLANRILPGRFQLFSEPFKLAHRFDLMKQLFPARRKLGFVFKIRPHFFKRF